MCINQIEQSEHLVGCSIFLAGMKESTFKQNRSSRTWFLAFLLSKGICLARLDTCIVMDCEGIIDDNCEFLLVGLKL